MHKLLCMKFYLQLYSCCYPCTISYISFFHPCDAKGNSVLATETIYCFFLIRLVFRLFACHWISENLLPQVSKSYCNSIISARCWHTTDNMVRLVMISCDWKSNGSAGDQILSESKLMVQNKDFWIYVISHYNILYFLFLS